jgi:hypothetical protein
MVKEIQNTQKSRAFITKISAYSTVVQSRKTRTKEAETKKAGETGPLRKSEKRENRK